ncbi:hypothetical protein TSUD_17480 [Trifolium subterraneum]|uniref:Major facilitator superfamily (MFS) profile domain-containing protein n=1 Tax=Trifolium subterraneum TaxID=3900 RepID=A0A2Z6M0M8_TRISU|nr:hypothetical protein TSUD_17480 [Trifolium subterraneum]
MKEDMIAIDYTQDGTIDLKGKSVPRSNTGCWKACSFLVVYGIFERMAYYGISSNLFVYLTKKLHQGTVTSSNNVTNWIGTIFITPILGAYIADAHLGRYRTFVISALIYLLGMCLLTLSVSLPSLKPPESKEASTQQLVVFYTALYILAVGTGGTKPNISTIGADQFDDFDPKEKALKLSFFNWWMSYIVIGSLFAFTVIVYIQDNVSWSLGYALPTIGLMISIITFLAGTPFYRHKLIKGSPYIRMAKVFVAAIRKWDVVVPDDPKELYELSLEEYTKQGKFKIDLTQTFRHHHSMWGPFSNSEIYMNFIKSVRDYVAPTLLIESYKVSVASTLLSYYQIVILGFRICAAEALLEGAKIEFFYDQAPESMKSLGTSYSLTTTGIGSFLSSLLLSTVSRVTEKHGRRGWILDNLNDSHLDYYYAFLAILNVLNFIFFVIVSKLYVYRAEVSNSLEVLETKLTEKKENFNGLEIND